VGYHRHVGRPDPLLHLLTYVGTGTALTDAHTQTHKTGPLLNLAGGGRRAVLARITELLALPALGMVDQWSARLACHILDRRALIDQVIQAGLGDTTRYNIVLSDQQLSQFPA